MQVILVVDGVIPVLDTGIQEFGLGTKLVSIKVADLMLKHNVLDEITARLDSSGLCCIATEKIWWLLTKFIIK